MTKSCECTPFRYRGLHYTFYNLGQKLVWNVIFYNVYNFGVRGNDHPKLCHMTWHKVGIIIYVQPLAGTALIKIWDGKKTSKIWHDLTFFKTNKYFYLPLMTLLARSPFVVIVYFCLPKFVNFGNQTDKIITSKLSNITVWIGFMRRSN